MNARRALEKMLDKQVMLNIFVKVKLNWRTDNNLLEEFGYFNENE